MHFIVNGIPPLIHTYTKLLDDAAARGKEVKSEGGDCKVLPSVLASYHAGERVETPTFNLSLALLEGFQLMAGETRRDIIQEVAPITYKKGYFDNPNVEYGERYTGRIASELHHLKKNRTSRRGVAYGGYNGEDGDSRPCAPFVHLHIGHTNKLEVFVTQRSWDLYKGTPYNIMMWGLAAQGWASFLDCSFARVTINANVPHLYLADIPKGEDAPYGAQARDIRLRLPKLVTIGDLQTWAQRHLEERTYNTPLAIDAF